MSVTIAVARRELRSVLRLPVGWVVTALFLLLTGLVFAFLVMNPGEPASLRSFFGVAGWLLLPVAPAISMRLLSDELKSGTIEPLMTSPAGDWSVVLGKYLGSLAFLVLMIAPTGVYVWLLYRFGEPAPDPGPIVAGYVMLALLGSLYLAVGLFASSLTSNQTLAFLGTLLALLVLLLMANAALPVLPPWAQETLSAVSINRRINDFSRGVIDLRNVVFFVSVSALFVLLAGVSLQSRRWR